MAAVLGVALSAAAQPTGGREDAFVEVVAVQDSYFRHQPAYLELRFGFEVGFLRDNLIQVFRQRLDVPAQLELDWYQPQGAPSAVGADGITTVINNEVAEITRAPTQRRGGKDFDVFTHRWRVSTDRLGERMGEAPVLKFAFATRFREDLVTSRVPLDRREGTVRGAPPTLRVVEVPAAGKPAGYAGAIGRFELVASVSPLQVEAGDRLELALRIDGVGSFGGVLAPELVIDGFHVYGHVAEPDGRGMTVRYHVTPLRSDLSRVPSIEFWSFDPRQMAYVVARSAPVPVQVTPATTSKRILEDSGGPGGDDIHDLKPSAAGHPWRLDATQFIVLVALLTPWLLAWLVRSRIRSRGARAVRVAPVIREAAAAHRSQSAQADADHSRLLVEFLAAALACPPASVISADLGDRLQQLGLTAELSRRAADVLDGMVAARYGGDSTRQSSDDAAALVADIEAALAPRR